MIFPSNGAGLFAWSALFSKFLWAEDYLFLAYQKKNQDYYFCFLIMHIFLNVFTCLHFAIFMANIHEQKEHHCFPLHWFDFSNNLLDRQCIRFHNYFDWDYYTWALLHFMGVEETLIAFSLVIVTDAVKDKEVVKKARIVRRQDIQNQEYYCVFVCLLFYNVRSIESSSHCD